ncbi:MgtC/SapB family protein [Aquibacillus albus]|uniref:Mg2+ transporter-C (MgtC) family protein n=1 Tax=Aquibacillus albus TaxID=1168171 RepID=A0ABS2N4U0_9BACI|nr:MgtC/SapB family protein [Aquibacillus albus]MBM7573123.1 putative Mg2+ transporter-C (MgtC) family protein [Aquibacillus albus]
MLWETIFDDNFILMMNRIFFALILSGLIGFERELKNHSAGFRTHILVGVGSCLMMLLSLYGFEAYTQNYEYVRFDPARIPSYVISGIGFLGAGTIIVNGMTIRGLTTAASIWAVAGLGLVVGAGMYKAAVLTTIVILLSLVLLNNLERHFRSKKNRIAIQLVVANDLNIDQLLSIFKEKNVKVEKLEIEKEAEDRRLFIYLSHTKTINKFKLFDHISKIDHIKQVTERQ